MAIGSALGLLGLGLAHHFQYLRYLATGTEPLSDWTMNLSLLGTLHRLLRGVGESWHFASVLTLTADGLIIVTLGRTIPRQVPPSSPGMDWIWGLGVTAIPLLSPLTEEHHLVLLLFPLFLLVLRDPGPQRQFADTGLLILSILLLGSRYSLERFPEFHAGLLSLLSTGKLLGVVGLAWVLSRRLRKTSERGQVA